MTVEPSATWEHVDTFFLAKDYVLCSHMYHEQCFGSWVREYKNILGSRVRIVWDGRDQWFTLEQYQDNRWVDLGDPIRQSDPESLEKFIRDTKM